MCKEQNTKITQKLNTKEWTDVLRTNGWKQTRMKVKPENTIALSQNKYIFLLFLQ